MYTETKRGEVKVRGVGRACERKRTVVAVVAVRVSTDVSKRGVYRGKGRRK